MHPSKQLGLVQIHLATLLFGFAGLFGKLDVSPATITAARTLLGCLTLALAAWFTKASFRLASRADLALLLAGGAVLAVHWFSFFQSIQISTVAIGLLSFASSPLFATFLEPLVFDEHLRWFDVAMAAIVVAGLALLAPMFDFGDRATQGVWWGVFSGFTFAVYSLLCRGNVRRYSQLVVNVYQQAFAMILVVPLAIGTTTQLSGSIIWKLAVLGIVLTAGAQTLFIGGLKFVRAQTASIITCLEPLYGIALAVPLAGEVPTGRTLLGGALILGAVIASTWRSARSQ